MSKILMGQDEEIEIYTYHINTLIVIGHLPAPYNKRHNSKQHYTMYKHRQPIIYSKRQYYDLDNSTISSAPISKNGN
ncbi:14279_t:CDS:1, partial [Dentiscutata erythropus]